MGRGVWLRPNACPSGRDGRVFRGLPGNVVSAWISLGDSAANAETLHADWMRWAGGAGYWLGVEGRQIVSSG